MIKHPTNIGWVYVISKLLASNGLAAKMRCEKRELATDVYLARRACDCFLTQVVKLSLFLTTETNITEK